MRTICKICEKALWRKAEIEWREAETERRFFGAAAGLCDGFIHFSRAAQLPGAAAKHFAVVLDLILVTVNAAALGGQLKWETSRGGRLFPHLYAPLLRSAVRWARPLADEIDGRRSFPELQP